MKRRELIQLSFLSLFATSLLDYNRSTRSHAIASQPHPSALREQEWSSGYQKPIKQPIEISQVKLKPACLSPAGCGCDDCVSISSGFLKL